MSLRHLVALAITVAMASAAHADSIGSASSAASAGSNSSRSLSDSIQNSSRSSSGTNVADGDYRITEVAQADGKPGYLQVRLRGEGERADEFTLVLPVEALGGQALVVGGIVHARNRSFGLEFARTQPATGTREAFFLALTDAAQRDMRSQALTL